MRSLLAPLACAMFLGTAPAQTNDIGLYLSGGLLTVIYGQECGPVGCTPFFGSVVAAGESRGLMHFSAPGTFFAIAIGFPGPCTPIPGIDNPLLLSSPVIIELSVTSAPPFVPLPCQQGIGSGTLTIPPAAPPGIVFRLQSIGISLSGVLALGPTIEATTI